MRAHTITKPKREGDGAILNYLSAEDVKRVAPIVKQFGENKEIVARLFVCPSPDADAVRAMGRFMINGYLNTPVYSEYHRWLGREELLGEMWKKWEAGDRKGAAAAVPDVVVDDIVIHGPPEACREHIQRYVENGIDTPMLMLLPLPGIEGGLDIPAFGLVIRAMQEDTNTNVLSMPNILTMDNEEATIEIGETVPFPSGGSLGNLALDRVPPWPRRNSRRSDGRYKSLILMIRATLPCSRSIPRQSRPRHQAG